MPTPWVAIPAALFMTPAQGVSAPQQPPVRQTYGDLVVEARAATFTEDVVTFKEGVKATFGQEVLTADQLILYPKEERAQAMGHVLLVDPDGTLSAEDLSFSWNPQTKGGSAKNVQLDMAGVLIRAATAQSIPGDPPTLVFTDVEGTSCARERTPLYMIRSPQVTFKPGKEGIIRRPTLYLFGRRIATLPNHRFSLDPRVKGIPLPGIAYRKSGEIGVRWSPSTLIDEQTALSANVRSFPGEPFTAEAYVTRSYLDPQRANSLIMPRSDTSERFSNDYFNNVRVASPERADKALANERRTLSLGTSWNRRSLNDAGDNRYTKLLEAVYEVGGPIGTFGYQGSLRAQNIRRDDDPFKTRLVAQGTIGSSTLPLGNRLFGVARLDSAFYIGDGFFNWTRGELGVYTTPVKWLTIGASYAAARESGDAMFPMDRLLIRNMGSLRADINTGPTQISYLLKRDLDRDIWYREYMVTQVMGCLEAFVISRQFPRSYQIGITFRLEEFLQRLRSRDLKRPAGTTPSTPAQAHVHP